MDGGVWMDGSGYVDGLVVALTHGFYIVLNIFFQSFYKGILGRLVADKGAQVLQP